MNSKLASSINGGNTAYERVESDFYPTPPEVTQALIDFLKIPKHENIWEPACGSGHMSRVFLENGYTVVSSDINQTEATDFTCDFTREYYDHECDWIITNPPFSRAEDFIKSAYDIGIPFAFLLKSQYWHSKKRLSLFRETNPTYILPLTWRPDFLFKTRGKGAPLMDCIWCVWMLQDEPTQYIPLEKPVLKIGERL